MTEKSLTAKVFEHLQRINCRSSANIIKKLAKKNKKRYNARKLSKIWTSRTNSNESRKLNVLRRSKLGNCAIISDKKTGKIE